MNSQGTCELRCRCVQEDEQSATVRCHYLTDGTVNFAFTIRRSEYFIPAGVLLKCFLEVSDKELYDKLVQSALVVSSSHNIKNVMQGRSIASVLMPFRA